MNDRLFDYSIAFSRNTGWLTPKEQDSMRSRRVAIAGLGGGGGGGHLLTLTRLGIGSFTTSDFDTFDLVEKYCKECIDLGHLDKLRTPRISVCEASRLAVHTNFRRRRGESKSQYGYYQAFHASKNEQRISSTQNPPCVT